MNLLHLNVTCCSLCFHYNKISLADKKYPPCTDAMTLQIKLNKDKNPSSPWEGGAGMKIRKYDPQTPPSPMNILPLHLYAPHNRLAKETRDSYSPVCPLSA